MKVGDSLENMDFSPRALRAEGYFKEGYNCSQSVVLAFADLIDIDQEALLRMSSPFGGGMGRLREVCGAVSGMYLVLGYLRGCGSSHDRQEKIDLYAEVRELAEQYRKINGSIVCRELLQGVPHTEGGIPEERTEAYYKKRPCNQLVAIATQLLENHLRSKGVQGL